MRTTNLVILSLVQAQTYLIQAETDKQTDRQTVDSEPKLQCSSPQEDALELIVFAELGVVDHEAMCGVVCGVTALVLASFWSCIVAAVVHGRACE